MTAPATHFDWPEGGTDGHSGPILSLAFAPHGRTLATASYDRTVILWDVSDPTDAAVIAEPPTEHRGTVYAVAFSPDGNVLASASLDQTVRLWGLHQLNAVRADVSQRACAIAGRGLDEGEWAALLPGIPYAGTCSTDP